MRKYIFILLFGCITVLGLSQSGPGGIGNSTNNILWLRGDDIGLSNGAAVTVWVDTSGNNNDAMQATPGLQPTYSTSQINGHNVVTFDGSDGLDLSSLTNAASDFSILMVYNTTTNTYIFDTEFGRQLVAQHGSGAYYDGTFHGTAISGTATKLVTWSLDNAGAEVFIDGTSYTTGTYIQTAIGGVSSLGCRYQFGSQFMTGDIAEVIIYNTAIDTSERIIIENYLASKYGLSISNDYYAYEANFSNELAGIGRIDASNLNDSAQSGGILTLKTPSDLGDDEFLLFAHDNGSIASWSSSNVPSSDANIRRLTREWRVDETGDLGTITFEIDTTLFPARPDEYSEFQLLVDADGDFTSGATLVPLSLQSGSIYEATTAAITDGDYLAICVVRPTIEFTITEANDFENTAGTVNVEVNLNYEITNSASVSFSVNGSSTATEGGGNDFTLSASPISITAGNTTNNISLTINDETDIELDETVILDISAPINCEIGPNAQYIYTINDNDETRTIQFSSTTSNSNEDASSVNIVVEISSTSSSDVTVDYTITGGTATGSGTDYILSNGTATVPGDDASTTANIVLIVNEDILDEINETVEITLSNPNINASIGGNTIHTFTINDNDGIPEVEFSSLTASVSENTASGTMEVYTSAISGQDITVDYTVADSTATGGGIDYTLASGTLTITSGNSTENITAIIVDDSSIEGSEIFKVILSNPMNATLGNDTILYFTIADNDNDGYSGPAGVGNSSNNILWLRAGDIAQSDGSAVAAWADTSGNDNDAIQVTAGLQPSYTINHLNGNAVVTFDGSDGLDLSALTNNASDFSMFMVFNTTTNTYIFDTEIGRQLIAQYPDGAYYDAAWKGTAITGTATKIASWQLDNAGAEVFVNGASYTTGTYTQRAIGGTSSLGCRYQFASQFTTGDIAEFIIYNNTVDTAKRIIIENYLSSKYGLSISNDYFAHDGSHYFDVAGIGRIDASNQHLSAESGKILRLASPSDLNDDEFLLFGHNNGSIASWTNSEVPNSDLNIQRITREWRVDETGDIGTISLILDTSLLPARPSEYTNFYALIDDDGDFSSGANTYPMKSLSGSLFEANNIDIADNYYISFAVVKPVIAFTDTISNEYEPNGPAAIGILLNFNLATNVTIDYVVSGGTATGEGSDFVLADGTLTITSGNTTKNINITLVDDILAEDPETIILKLRNPSLGLNLGDDSTHIFTINDDDNARKIYFQTDSTGADESITPDTVIIEITTTSGSDVSVDYTITGGTAQGSGIDYSLANGTLTIAGGSSDTTAFFEIAINEDILDEESESIIITLSNPVNCNLADTNTIYEYTIVDNDSEPTIQFTSTTASGSEALSPGTIEVSLSGISGQDITVDYTVADLTATGGEVDYRLNNGTLTITAGNSYANISPIIVDDTEIEGGETFTVTLSNPSGAILGANTINTYTISDNDDDGFTGPAGIGSLSTNILWLRAGDLNLTNGAAVTSWADTSGNNYDAVQGTASLQPSFTENHINDQDVVTFDGGDGLDLSLLSNPASNYSIFMVYNTSTETYIFDSQTGRQLVAQYANGAYYDGVWQGTAITGASTKLVNWQLNGTGAEVFIDGASFTTDTYTQLPIGGTTSLGCRYQFSSQFMTGDIAEVIIYNKIINSAQRKILENYLGAKYGLSITNDYYAFQVTHNYEISGIGMVDGSNVHTVAQSAGILKISSPSDFDNNEFLIFGHNNASISSWSTTEIPITGSNIQRIAREWMLDETGDVGTVTITLDTSRLPARPNEYSNFYVIIDADGDFTEGAITYPMELLSGSEFESSAIDVEKGNYVSFAVVKPVIEFTDTTSSEFEPFGPVSIEISLNYPLGSDITIDYTIDGSSTATGGGVDYTLSDGTVTITAGNTTANLNIPLVNDILVEDSEIITLNLSNPTAGINLGTNTQHIYVLNDDDNPRKIKFVTSTNSHDESVSSDTVMIELNNLDTFNPTTVEYTVTGGTATGGGTDYTLANGTATIPANDTSTTFVIAINDDILDEENETIIVSLSFPTNCNLNYTDIIYTDTIIDNNSEPTVQFTSSTNSASESVTPANIEVSLSTISGYDVTVDYTVADGTATGGYIDYNLANGTLTILAGDQNKAIKPVILDDSDIESGETFTVTLSNPTNATLGANTVNTYTISDNDDAGNTGPAGIGSSVTNILWLRADDLNLSNGAAVTSWADTSGNNNDALQATTSLQPSFTTNHINSLPVVTFDGGDGLDLTGLTSLASDFSIFMVYNTSTETYIFDVETGRQLVAQYTSGAYYDGTWQGTAITGTSTKIVNWKLDNDGAEVFIDGTSHTTDTYTQRAIGGTISLGCRYQFASQFMTGDIAEVILYNTALDTTKRIIIENYLSNKYNLSIANDYYTHDITHHYELAGIGRTNDTDNHTSAQSGGILSLSSASDLDNSEFMLFAHDNGDISSWTTSEAPDAGANIQRIAREWKIDETGDLGTVSITLDTSLLTIRPNDYDLFYLLVDADGNFASDASKYYMTSVGGSNFEASGVNLNDNDFLTIAVVRPVIQFTNTSSSEFEPLGPASIEISLNSALGADTDIDYSISGGTATGGGTDYVFSGGTATITAGNTTTNLFITLVNDILVESAETIELQISNPTLGILGSNTSHTFTINDDDNLRKILFSVDTASGDEATTPVTIQVEINTVDNSNPTTVDYAISGGSATGSGTDYTIAEGTLTIAATTLNNTFDITIVNDALYESDETIEITLSNPTNCNIADTNTVFTYTINDDDTEPTVQFTSTSSTISEGTALANLEVSLSNSSGDDVLVDYAVTGGTATGGGTDYLLISGTLTITSGNSSDNISISITDDGSVEDVETIQITISNPSGAILGANSIHTLSINDNDESGFEGPAGVGSATTNLLWLRGDDIGISNGAAVTAWADASGNNNNAIQGTASLQPVYTTNHINGHDVVTFDGTEGLDLSALTSAASDYSIFMVYNTTTATYIFDSQTGRFITAHGSTGAYYYGAAWQGTTISGTNTQLINWQLDDAGAEVFIDGTSHTTDTYTKYAIGGTTSLGCRYQFGSQFMTGDIAEVIIYNNVVDTAKRYIIENYLGTKYGLSIANDLYSHDAGHGNELAGIGRYNSNNKHTAAKSAKIIKIGNAGDLGDGEYLLFGHDNGDITTWTTTDQPNTVTERLARVWRFDETGNVGTVEITVDTALLPARNAGFESYILLVDSDGVFAAGAISYGLTSAGGSEFLAASVDIADNDYLAIATATNITLGDGDFNNAANWATGSVPGSGEKALIDVNHDMFLTANTTIGSLELNNTATLDLAGFTLIINNGSIVLNGSASIDASDANCKIKYSQSGAQNIASMTYNHLEIDGSGTKTLSGNIIINGNLTINNGLTLDAEVTNDYNITIGGNWTNSGTFTPQEGTVTFNGSSSQSISASTTQPFYNLTINNAANNITLNRAIEVSNTLTLTDGNIILGNHDITITSSGTISGGSSSSYIQADGAGGVIKEFSNGTGSVASITFFVGDNNDYSPFTFSLNDGTRSNASVTIRVKDLKHPNLASSTDYITRYWIVTPNGISCNGSCDGGAGDILYNMSYIYDDADIVGTESGIEPMKYSSGIWTKGGNVTVGTNTLAWNNVNSFSDMTGGDGEGALPIEILSFTGELFDNSILIKWSTANEFNNDFFTLEKSNDAVFFQPIAMIQGAGNSNEVLNYEFLDTDIAEGIYYYRLKQTDFNGDFTYSNIISLYKEEIYNSELKLLIYPNPVDNGILNVELEVPEESYNYEIRIFDIMGTLVYQSINNGNNKFEINVNNYKSGIYFFSLLTKDNKLNKRLIIK